MLINNNHTDLKVHEWISKYTNLGTFDIVNTDQQEIRTIDLLNETVTVDSVLKLNKIAREAVTFFEQNKVSCKTLEPNFCHAKLFIITNKENDVQKKYFITGSSNLTDAGMGLKPTSNVELNIGGFGSEAQFGELCTWFEKLWKNLKAYTKQTVIDHEGKTHKIDFKQYLIDEISKVFKEYYPKDIYYKIFGNVLISCLGKTWTALRVMTYYQSQGYKSVLLCPKKLHQNWRKFHEPKNIFEKDGLDYKIRFHSDLQDNLWNSYSGSEKIDIKDFQDSSPKLLVIDESHNLRNNKSNRYKELLKILEGCEGDVKVLLLTATPINNSLLDIRNQFLLITKGNKAGFYESLDIRNIDGTFRKAQRAFNEWRVIKNKKIDDFKKALPYEFFTLMDSLTIARTRSIVKEHQSSFQFPHKAKPLNIYETPVKIGNYETFEEILEHFPPVFAGNQPSLLFEQDKDVSVLNDQQQRDHFLVKMIHILLAKRYEESEESGSVSQELSGNALRTI